MRPDGRSRFAESRNRANSSLPERLRAAWYGPLAGLAGICFIALVPAVHQCFGVAGSVGTQSGSFCGWESGFAGTRPDAVLELVAAVVALLILQVLFSDPRYLVGIGVATTLLWIVCLAFIEPNYNVSYWASSHGVGFRSGLETETLVMLPSGLLPLIAGIRRLRRQSSEAAAVS